MQPTYLNTIDQTDDETVDISNLIVELLWCNSDFNVLDWLCSIDCLKFLHIGYQGISKKS